MRRAFTLVEVLVVICIVAIVAGLLFPVLSSARQKARSSACVSNLRQLTVASLEYCDSNDGAFARNNSYLDGYWLDQLKSYGASGDLFCPGRASLHSYFGRPLLGYALNQCLVAEGGVPNSARTIAFTEVTGGRQVWRSLGQTDEVLAVYELSMPDKYAFSVKFPPQTGREVYPELPFGSERHFGGSNYAFVDGHVRWFRPLQIRFTPDWTECFPRERIFPGDPETWLGPSDGPSFRFLP
ncbi:MAG TPA: prepilin-type N-terminal cleavage/methylation domain-containing protein [Fimbriimonadaceae bacterium]|nr:prepilin-type N-terminal cleavage/methylation domain-containing protein [Fimbriimonadaceae bacterium]